MHSQLYIISKQADFMELQTGRRLEDQPKNDNNACAVAERMTTWSTEIHMESWTN